MEHLWDVTPAAKHTRKRTFLGQEVRENHAFLFRSPRGFPLSVWPVSRNREGSVAASADFFYIFRASADGNPISRCCSREMGLPSAATLEM